METTGAASITALLQQWRRTPQDEKAADRAARAVYAELRRIAAARLRSESRQPYSPTELVHEVWLQLDVSDADFGDRGHFFRVASKAMRQLLIDRARERLAQKRGNDPDCVSLRVADLEQDFTDSRLLDLDAALQRLSQTHRRHAETVMLRCFAGLSLEEIAHTQEVALATVKRDLAFASAWLGAALNDSGDAG